jgi:hypothetical protein
VKAAGTAKGVVLAENARHRANGYGRILNHALTIVANHDEWRLRPSGIFGDELATFL